MSSEYSEIIVSDLSIDEIKELFPPNSLVTKGTEDTP